MRINRKYFLEKAELFCYKNNRPPSSEAHILADLLEEVAADQRQASADAIILAAEPGSLFEITKEAAAKIAFNACEKQTD